MSSADADDPPRSRLFVVCPKGTGQDTLQRAFEDLLAKLSAEDPPFASARGETTTARKDPDEDARKDEHHDDGLDEEDVGDEPPLVKHLESVRVVPRKGVAFAKFSDAATAMRCMAAIADANGALGALRVKCMLAEPKASAGAGAGAAERANGTPPPPPPPPPPPGGAAAAAGPAAAGSGGGVAAGSRPRGERSGEPPGGSASPKRARRGGDGDGNRTGDPNNSRPAVFPPPPHQTPACVLGSESRRRHHRTSRTSPTSSAESGGGIGGRGIGRSPVQNPVPSPPPMPPGPPPGVFLGEAWMGDGRRGALVFHPRTGGVPTLGVPTLVHPAAGAPPPPPHYPPPAFAHFPSGTAPHPHASAPNATPNFVHHAHVPGVHPRPNAPPPPPPDWPPPSPAASARSGASSALSGGGGGGGGGVTRGGGGGGGGAGEVTTSADSDSVRSNGGGVTAAGHTRRAFVVLDKTVTQSHLESLFRDTCEGVITVDLKTDGHSGKSRGFAYVTFESPAFVQAACERLNGRELPEGSGVRCKVMPALDREHRPTPERSNGSNKRRSNGNGNGNGRGGAGSAAGGASSGEGADRSTRTEAPSPSPESDLAKKKTRTMNEEKEEEEEEDDDDDDALSWQLPGPRKYSRLNSPSAGDVVPAQQRSFDPDDDGAIREEDEEDEEDDDDDDEAESGVEAASSRRLVLRRDASRSKAEEEATDAAMALGKVSLGVVPEEDTTAVLAEGDRTTRREGGTDAEPSDGTSPDDALDKFEGEGDDGPGGNRTRDLSDRDDDEPADAAGAGETTDRKPVNRRPGKSESEPASGEVAGSIPPGAGRVLFFRLALPLPSYALRHVLASHGEVAELSMRPDGASGRVEYADEEGADAALEALHATEILGIELRVSRLQADVVGKKAAAEGGGADQRKKRTRRA